jgi:hypothetical protein
VVSARVEDASDWRESANDSPGEPLSASEPRSANTPPRDEVSRTRKGDLGGGETSSRLSALTCDGRADPGVSRNVSKSSSMTMGRSVVGGLHRFLCVGFLYANIDRTSAILDVNLVADELASGPRWVPGLSPPVSRRERSAEIGDSVVLNRLKTAPATRASDSALASMRSSRWNRSSAGTPCWEQVAKKRVTFEVRTKPSFRVLGLVNDPGRSLLMNLFDIEFKVA